jgi:PKD repeat protein
MVSTRTRIRLAVALAALAVSIGCAIEDQTKPSFTGPSELGLSLALTATPDTLYWDGASRSLINIQARNSTGQPAANVQALVQVVSVNPSDTTQRVPYDLGSISARSIVTGPDGRASVTYTAPLLTDPSGEVPIWIWVTPSEGNAANQFAREVQIRLLPPGVVLPPNGAPTADFNISGPMVIGSTVTFDATPSTDPDGSIVSYAWIFGDGTTGSGKVVTHSYSASGSYNITLTVTDDRGVSVSTTKSATIGDTTAPTATLTFSPSAPKAGESVFFNGQRSTPANGRYITDYRWDFGDGGSGSGETASHTYAAAGTYVVTLVVTDDIGKTGAASSTVAVTGAAAPTASFVYSPTGVTVGLEVRFDAAASTAPTGRTITTWAWNFGDGNTETETNPNVRHTFTATGNYIVRLTVTDSTGATGTTTQTITVTQGLTASFTLSPTSGGIGTTINVNASGSTAAPGRRIVSYAWDFGNGSTSSGSSATASTSYAATGTFTITLTVTDDLGARATTTKTIAIS